MIIARPGAGRSNFFSAIAGLWPWGSGRISLPVGQAMMFLSNRPYLPPGTLRAAIAYPSPAKNFEEGFAAALQRIGLARLLPDLDHSHRWERELGSDEQQSLQFARLLLHKPRWVLINEALDALDEDTRAIVLDLFRRNWPGRQSSTSAGPTRKGFFSRVLHLIEDPHGETLASHLSPGVAATPTCDAGANANVID